MDDSGRTPEGVAYVRREIRRRLQRLDAVEAAYAASCSKAPGKAESPDDA